MDQEFWNQFWPQFWGGVASTIFVTALAVLFTYVARLKIVLFVRTQMRALEKKILAEEHRIEEEVEGKL